MGVQKFDRGLEVSPFFQSAFSHSQAARDNILEYAAEGRYLIHNNSERSELQGVLETSIRERAALEGHVTPPKVEKVIPCRMLEGAQGFPNGTSVSA